MNENQFDEDLKIKKLKEYEEYEFIEPSRKIDKQKVVTLLVFTTGLIMFVCVCLGMGLIFIKNRQPSYTMVTTPHINNPVINTPVIIATDMPIDDLIDPLRLNINALSTELAQETHSTISFEINHVADEGRNLCTGHYEITDMTQLRKVHEASYTGENNSRVKGLWIGLVASDGQNTNHEIGDETPLYDGNVGKTYFNLVTEPQFRQVANRFTDGVSDWVVLSATFLDMNDHTNGGSSQGDPEWHYFGTESDLTGHAIKLIRRDISKLIIQPDYYYYDVTWSFWESKEPDENHWLYISPTTGTLNPGESQTIQVTFSSNALEPGQYITELLVDYGENCSAPTTIPVTLTVLEN